MAKMDKYNTTEFYAGTVGWSSYLPILYAALEYTKFGDVLELGIGSCSTRTMGDYCNYYKRQLYSYDNNAEYAEVFLKHRSEFHSIEIAKNWDNCPIDKPWSVALVDHAPGERRIVDTMRLAQNCKILVLHDTEPSARHGYLWDEIFGNFKSVRHYDRFNCWATGVSNFIDLKELNIPDV